LRTALRAAVAAIAARTALMSAVMAATAVSGTAATIETAASTASTIGTSTAIATITAATAVSAAAAAEWALEAGARAAAAADTSRIARLKFFTRSAAAARSAGFAGEKNFVFGRAGCRDLLRLAFELAIVLFTVLARVPVGIVFVMFVRFTVLVVFFVRRLAVFEIDMIAESGDMQRVLVRGIGFRFRNGLRRANSFPGFGFVRFMFARLVFLVVFVRFVLFVVFRLFFVDFDFLFEDRAAGDSVGVHDFANLVLLRINQAGRKSGALVVAEL